MRKSKIIEIEDWQGNTIMSFNINKNGEIVDFLNCEIADIKFDGTIRLQQIEETF